MPKDDHPTPPRRHTLRLRDYDYALAGAYFVTICTHERACLFGAIENKQMRLSRIGRIAAIHWCDLIEHFPTITLDAFIVMPNHVHGIILLRDVEEDSGQGARGGGRDQPGQTGEACLAPTDRPGAGAGEGARGGVSDLLGGLGEGARGGGRDQPGQTGEACLAPTDIPAVSVDGGPLQRQRVERPTLGTIVAAFKASATRNARRATANPHLHLWQRNYYEHVIRNEQALTRIRQYIEDNPAKWALDHDNPATWH